MKRKTWNVTMAAFVASGLLLAGCEQSAEPEATVTPASDTASASAAPAADTGEAKPSDGVQPLADQRGTKEDPKALTLDSKGQASSLTSVKPTGAADTNGQIVVIAEPARLDIGEIPTNDSAVGVVKLVNTGDKPMTIKNCRSSCGCTAPKCPEGKVLEPGESVDVEVRMSGGARPAQINKTVTFFIEGQPPLQVPVSGEAVSFITSDPPILRVEDMPNGEVVLTAKDDQPFIITRMHPPIITSFGTEPAVSHTVSLDWGQWEALGAQRWATFYTDHPKATQIRVSIYSTDVQAQPAQPTRQVADRPEVAPQQPRELPASLLIQQGQTEKVLEKLADGSLNANDVDRKNVPLLSLAAEDGQLEIMEAMLDRGADPEAADRTGKTPLMYAAQSGSVEAVRMLLDSGASVRTTDTAVGTALSWGAGFGNAEIVTELIEAGSDVNVTATLTGYTPVIWAAMVGQPGAIDALAKAGASLEIKDNVMGATALMYAAQTGKNENIEALIRNGADLEQQANDGKTAFLVAASMSGATADTIRTLAESGANVNATDMRGYNALDLASRRTDIRAADVVSYLSGELKLTPLATAKEATDDAAAEAPAGTAEVTGADADDEAPPAAGTR